MFRKRFDYLDVVCAIMLSFMMLGHITSWDKDFLDCTRYMFFMFMPWFFYKNGMFIQIEKLKNTSFSSLLKKDSYRLLLPFVVWGLLGSIVQLFFVILHNESIISYISTSIDSLIYEGRPYGNPPLWFLFSLFLCRQIFVVSAKLHIPVYVLAFFSLFGACACNYFEYHTLQWIGVSLCGLFFVCIGNLLSTCQISKVMLFLSLLSYLIFLLVGGAWVDMSSNVVAQGNYIMWILSCVPGIVLVNNFARFICGKSRFFIVRILENVLKDVGKNSMIYYVAHWLVIMSPAHAITNFFNVEANCTIYMVKVCLCLFILPLVNYIVKLPKLRWMVGL